MANQPVPNKNAPQMPSNPVLREAVKAFRADNADTFVMFVLRDGQGHARTDLLRTQTLSWKAMWNKRYCTLELPAVPDAPGDYTVELYFDNTFVLSKSFTVSVG